MRTIVEPTTDQHRNTTQMIDPIAKRRGGGASTANRALEWGRCFFSEVIKQDALNYISYR